MKKEDGKGKLIFVGLILVTILVRCDIKSDKSLTRQLAGDLISKSEAFTKEYKSIRFHDEGFEKGIKQGVWRESKTKRYRAELTERAQATIKYITVANLLLKQPVKIRLLQVTGITDALIVQGMKEANFTWEYKNLPSLVKRFVVQGGSGIVYMRLYDDGWRLEKIEIEESSDPAKLTQREKAQEQKDERIETERKRIQEEREARRRQEEAERKRIKAERRAKLVKKASTPTRVIANAKVKMCAMGNLVWLNDPANYSDLTLTDVNISSNLYCKKKNYSVWFGDIKYYEINPPWRGILIEHKNDGRTIFVNPEKNIQKVFFEKLDIAIKAWRKRYPTLK